MFSFGILTCEILAQILAATSDNEFALDTLDTNLAIQVLKHFKYTEAIDPSESQHQNQAFFLPGLLQEMGVPDKWEGEHFGFAMSIVPVKTQEKDNLVMYFLPRFLKKLLLCLILKFIMPVSQHMSHGSGCSSQSSMNESVAVWSRGLSWLTPDGIKVNVVTNDDAIILSMYSALGREIRCIRLRNKIVKIIDGEREKFQKDIKTETFILPNKNKTFPVKSFGAYRDQWISVDQIHKSITKGEMDFQGVQFSSLLFFEPGISLSELSIETRTYLTNPHNTDKKLDDVILTEIYKSFSNAKQAVVDYFCFPVLNEGEATTNVSDLMSPSLTSTNSSSTRSNISASQNATSTKQEDLTCGKFLNLMSAISIMNVQEFLSVIKVRIAILFGI